MAFLKLSLKVSRSVLRHLTWPFIVVVVVFGLPPILRATREMAPGSSVQGQVTSTGLAGRVQRDPEGTEAPHCQDEAPRLPAAHKEHRVVRRDRVGAGHPHPSGTQSEELSGCE